MTATNPKNSSLSLEEIEDSISKLPDTDWIRLRKVANKYSYGIDPDELLQKAFLAALEGRRNCPRDIDIVRYLSETMRSLASSNQKARQRKPESQFSSIDNIGNGLHFDPPSGNPSPEQEICSIQESSNLKATILKLFSDDEIAQTITEGIMEGMETEELLDLTGLDNTKYASKRRLIRRRIDRAYPEGWQL